MVDDLIGGERDLTASAEELVAHPGQPVRSTRRGAIFPHGDLGTRSVDSTPLTLALEPESAENADRCGLRPWPVWRSVPSFWAAGRRPELPSGTRSFEWRDTFGQSNLRASPPDTDVRSSDE
jgi:hypothetical protein